MFAVVPVRNYFRHILYRINKTKQICNLGLRENQSQRLHSVKRARTFLFLAQWQNVSTACFNQTMFYIVAELISGFCLILRAVISMIILNGMLSVIDLLCFLRGVN
jgi:hypothetical protein